jgi:hypothetical protein
VLRRLTMLLALCAAPSLSGAVEGLVDGTGDDRTLALLYELNQFQLPDASELTTQIWFDPYRGDDFANDGTLALPYRSIAKMKEVCASHVRCTIYGPDRVFSPLTLRLTGIAPGENFQKGEQISWDDGASTGTVLDWSVTHQILVIDRDTGQEPVSGEIGLRGVLSSAEASILAEQGILNTVGGHVVHTFSPSAIDPATGAVAIAGHSYGDGEGPMRFHSSGALPSGLSKSVDYYVCVSTPSGFRLDDDADCTSPFTSFSSTGTGMHGIAGAANSRVDDPIIADCHDSNRVCVLIEAQDPGHPAVIDGNRFHATGYDNRTTIGVFGPNPDDGLAFVAGPGGGWVGWQNVQIQNIAIDAFSNQSASVGKLVVLNSPARDIRNGSENRTSNVATNNCYTSHGAGALIALNGGGSESLVNDPLNYGTGACLAPTGTGKFTVIGNGTYRSERVGATPSATLASTGSDVVVIGHELLGATSGNSVISFSASDGAGRLHLARVVLRSSSTGDGSGLSLIGGSFATTVRIFESTIHGDSTQFGEAIWVGPIRSAGLDFLAQGLLIDDYPIWLETANRTTSFANTRRFRLEGYYDDQDTAGGDADEFLFYPGVTAKTIDQAQSAAQLFGGRNWSLFQERSFDSNGSAPGTAWLSDVADLRCQPSEACWAAYRDWYSIPLETTLAPEPERSCIPADVLGERICRFRLRGTHIGARGALDSDADLLADVTEYELGTDPFNPDTDGDGLEDQFERLYEIDPLVPGDGVLDPDGDGLDNLAEQTIGTHPFVSDSDGDGLLDAAELLAATDPLDRDTDDDGLWDQFELTHGFDPRVSGDGRADPDGDGLDNLAEQSWATDPRDPDTDDDGYSDRWEVDFYSDPLRPESIPIPTVPGIAPFGLVTLGTLMLWIASQASRRTAG